MKEKDILSTCGCGKPLYPVFDEWGNRIGVTHATIEDEEYHSQYFAGLIAIEPPESITLN